MKSDRLIAVCVLVLSGFCCSRLSAQSLANSQLASGPFVFPFRQPLGIYARDTSNCSPAAGQTTEQCLSLKAIALVNNPAVAGINPELDWSDLNPSFGAYDWTELQVVFEAVDAWNKSHPNQPRKTIQIDVNPGFHSPQWLFDNMSSCDPMFAPVPEANPDGTLNPNWLTSAYSTPDPSLVPRDCGYTTFRESENHATQPYLPLPLPWSPYYQYAWGIFVRALAQQYGSNPDLVSVAIDGPTASSAEMILPNEDPTTGDPLDFYKWDYLLALTFPPSYQNSDRAIVEAWQNAIDLYSEAFSGLTLVVTTGSGLPNFLSSTGTPLTLVTVPPGFQPACESTDQTKMMDCAAEESVVAYLANPLHGGFNLKSSQENGLGAGGINHDPLGGGDLATWGIRWLAETSERGVTLLPDSFTFVSKMFGGLQSGGDLTTGYPSNDTDLQDQGCNLKGTQTCPGLTPEQGLFNFLAAYFDGSKAGAYYGPNNVGDPTGPGIATGLIPLNYLQMYDIDIAYATSNACDISGGLCTQNEVTNGEGNTSLQSFQSELETAAAQIRQIADPTVP